MPEQDNDKLDQFFRKAASGPDIPFQESDWKKLEARLDARMPAGTAAKNIGAKVTGTLAVALLLILGSFYYNSNEDQPQLSKVIDAGSIVSDQEVISSPNPTQPGAKIISEDEGPSTVKKEIRVSAAAPPVQAENSQQQSVIADPTGSDNILSALEKVNKDFTLQQPEIMDGMVESSTPERARDGIAGMGISKVGSRKLNDELIQISPAVAEQYKQKAGGSVPGAEEADSREVDAVVKEEHASNDKKHPASPRLSLLLSLAPDFSSTHINEYAAPGGAFGLMIHYHLGNAWSISTGLVENNKKYTGEGSEYQPPKGYWKYYTNGVRPSTIDGSCNVLEIPLMVQYTVANMGKSRLLLGTGTSSYLMLKESYRYNFEQPNPGAREGWDSKKSSRFLFNMINFTVAFEHQILPGFMIGIEPYVKVPIAEIGWSKLKLYSTGASFTLRYNLIKKESSNLTLTRSRSPD